jgi:hypothetical protein
MNTLLRNPGPARAAAREIEMLGEAAEAAELATLIIGILNTCGDVDTRRLAIVIALAEQISYEDSLILGEEVEIGALALLVQDHLAERQGRAAEAAARSVP